MILLISQLSGFQPVGINSGQLFQWFSMDLALKMIAEALFCFPLASLGSIREQLSASLGNLGSPHSSIFDASPCLGNMFCDLRPPRCLPRQMFQEFYSKCIKIQPKYHQVLDTWAVRGLHKLFTSSDSLLQNCDLSITQGLQASKPPSASAGDAKRKQFERFFLGGDLPANLKFQFSPWFASSQILKFLRASRETEQKSPKNILVRWDFSKLW